MLLRIVPNFDKILPKVFWLLYNSHFSPREEACNTRVTHVIRLHSINFLMEVSVMKNQTHLMKFRELNGDFEV